MWRHLLSNVCRASLLLSIVPTVLVSAVGPPPPMAAAQLREQPYYRLQLVVQSIEILDDREGRWSGAGEMEFHTDIWMCVAGEAAPCLNRQDTAKGSPGIVTRMTHTFGAKTGDVVTLDRAVPGEGDETRTLLGSPTLGFPVFASAPTVMRMYMSERDGGSMFNGDEYMGSVYRYLDTEPFGRGIGVHTVRSSIHPGQEDGDFKITYEIRPAPLPDILPVDIAVQDLPGSADERVCMAVRNVGPVNSGAFNVMLKLNGREIPGVHPYVPGVASGQTGEACATVQLPDAGSHTLMAVVDPTLVLKETVESNNLLEMPYTGTTSAQTVGTEAASTQASGTQAAGAADLTIGAIKVNGRAPDGKDDCKDGKNSTTIVVKNGGTTNADAFAVQLAIDNPQGSVEQLVTGLEAGKEVEVRFEDAKLKKGDRTLTITVDSKGAVTESKEDNNERKVTAQCRDDH